MRDSNPRPKKPMVLPTTPFVNKVLVQGISPFDRLQKVDQYSKLTQTKSYNTTKPSTIIYVYICHQTESSVNARVIPRWCNRSPPKKIQRFSLTNVSWLLDTRKRAIRKKTHPTVGVAVVWLRQIVPGRLSSLCEEPPVNEVISRVVHHLCILVTKRRKSLVGLCERMPRIHFSGDILSSSYIYWTFCCKPTAGWLKSLHKHMCYCLRRAIERWRRGGKERGTVSQEDLVRPGAGCKTHRLRYFWGKVGGATTTVEQLTTNPQPTRTYSPKHYS